MSDAGAGERRGRTISAWVLGLYVFALALIALWPDPVDRDLGWFFAILREHVPGFSYRRGEIAANVVLFVPYGALLSFVLPRSRHLVLPIAFLTTAAIESAQSLLPNRTTSLTDIIANTAGACIGILLAAGIRWMAGRRGSALRRGVGGG